MKRIILVLSILLAMILSGCDGNKEEQMKLVDAASIPEVETSVPTEIPTETPEPTQLPTEASEPTELPAETSETIAMLAEASDAMDVPLPPYLSETKLEITAENIFQILPPEFLFVESFDWTTEFTINEDGTFTGNCCSLGYTDKYYSFHGKFTNPQKVGDYIYSMKLESVEFDNSSEIVYEEYDYDNKVDVQKTLTVPKGFENAGEFLIYLPGCPLEDLPEEYLPECSINTRIRETIPSGVYRMYNVSGKAGFMAEDEDSFWNQRFTDSASQAELAPNYCLKSNLYFLQETKYDTSLWLEFDWRYDTQTHFLAADSNGTGQYNITLEYSEDYRTMIVTAKNTTVFNLEPWGGTADGTISAEFPVNNRLPFDFLQTEQEATSVFSMMPSQFHHGGMGAGGWRSYISLNEDGTFTGEYSDSNMGLFGPGYSHGEVSICDIRGQFTTPKKISDYIYSVNVESLEFEVAPGTVYFQDDFMYCATDAFAFDAGSEVLIYLPGCPLTDITFPEYPFDELFEPETIDSLLRWYGGFDTEIWQTLPRGVYLLYRVGAMNIYKAEVEDELVWYKTYEYKYGSYRSKLQPGFSYYSSSSKHELAFLSESGDRTLNFEFELDYDSQGESVITDSNGTGEYNLSLDFSEDFNSVVVSLKSLSGFNLEPWGGTADGMLTAEYQVQ